MVSEKVKLLSLLKKGEKGFEIDLEIEGERKSFPVSVIDDRGLFGVEFPVELSALMRNYSNADNQRLVAEIKKCCRSSEKISVLQAV